MRSRDKVSCLMIPMRIQDGIEYAHHIAAAYLRPLHSRAGLATSTVVRNTSVRAPAIARESVMQSCWHVYIRATVLRTLAVMNKRQYKRRRTVDQAQETRDFNLENHPVEGKKSRTPANKSSLYRVRLQTSNIYNLGIP